MTQGSLRRRLFAAGAASILVALALAGFGLLLMFERHVERRMTGELASTLRQLLSGLDRAADGSLELVRSPAEPRFLEPLSGLYWQIAVEPNGPSLRSRSLWDASLSLPADELAGGEVHEHTIGGPGGVSLLAVERLVVLPGDTGGVSVRAAVAIDRAEIHRAGLAFVADLVPSLALLALVLIVAAWAQVAIGLRPLDELRRRLAAVRAGDEPRLGDAFPDEVRPLAAELDHLLEAQEAAIARARARAADLAHGLKTPLTVLASDADALRARGEATLADEIASLTAGMRRHVDRELARARIGVRPRAGSASPLRRAVEQVIAVLRRTPRGHRLDWRIEIGDHVTTVVEAEDLAEMLGNLGENAATWAGSVVRFAAGDGASSLRVRVEDDGPGVPEDRVAVVLARGGRLDESQPGTGLGLSITRELVESYGGSLALRRSDLGGLCAELTLPAR